jgi:hypothetical protein
MAHFWSRRRMTPTADNGPASLLPRGLLRPYRFPQSDVADIQRLLAARSCTAMGPHKAVELLFTADFLTKTR